METLIPSIATDPEAALKALLMEIAVSGVGVAQHVREALPKKTLKAFVQAIHKKTGMSARDMIKAYPKAGLNPGSTQRWIDACPVEEQDCFFAGWQGHPKRDANAVSLVEFDRTHHPFNFDPFSRYDAEREYIKAGAYYGLDNGHDGFTDDWPKGARVRVNPPWDSESVRRAAKQFLKMHRERGVSGIFHAPLFSEHGWISELRDAGASICYLFDRPWFKRPNGRVEQGGMWNIAHCLISSDPMEHVRFAREYSRFGIVACNNPAVMRLQLTPTNEGQALNA